MGAEIEEGSEAERGEAVQVTPTLPPPPTTTTTVAQPAPVVVDPLPATGASLTLAAVGLVAVVAGMAARRIAR